MKISFKLQCNITGFKTDVEFDTEGADERQWAAMRLLEEALLGDNSITIILNSGQPLADLEVVSMTRHRE